MADCLQFGRHPFRGCAVGHARHGLRVKGRTAFRVIGANGGCRIGADYRCQLGHAVDFGERLECAEPGCRQIARDTAYAHAVLPVGGDRHIQDSIVEPRPIGIDLPDRRIGWQLDDAIMVIAQFELGNRTHHAVRFDAANRCDLQHHAV